jgi:hypothetical protein
MKAGKSSIRAKPQVLLVLQLVLPRHAAEVPSRQLPGAAGGGGGGGGGPGRASQAGRQSVRELGGLAAGASGGENRGQHAGSALESAGRGGGTGDGPAGPCMHGAQRWGHAASQTGSIHSVQRLPGATSGVRCTRGARSLASLLAFPATRDSAALRA